MTFRNLKLCFRILLIPRASLQGHWLQLLSRCLCPTHISAGMEFNVFFIFIIRMQKSFTQLMCRFTNINKMSQAGLGSPLLLPLLFFSSFLYSTHPLPNSTIYHTQKLSFFSLGAYGLVPSSIKAFLFFLTKDSYPFKETLMPIFRIIHFYLPSNPGKS